MKGKTMENVSIISAYETANSLVMNARIQSNGPILDKLRRISRYIESQMAEVLKQYAS